MGIELQVTLLLTQITLLAAASKVHRESSPMNFVDLLGGFYGDCKGGLLQPGSTGQPLAGRKRARPLSEGFNIKI